MRKVKTLLGLNVISQLEGKQLGTVRDVIFDEQSSRLTALLLSDRDLFGLIDAQVVPFSQVREIGPNAVMVPNDEALIKAHSDPMIAENFDGKKKLDGKKITTQRGEDLGTVSDIYFDNLGAVVGYEVSGGLFADAFSGKRYMAAPADITIGDDVILVPQEIATELERQKQNQPGGLSGAASSVGGAVSDAASNVGSAVSGAYGSARTKVSEGYESLAGASVEKQREFVIGKVASRDVIIPAAKATMATPSSVETTTIEDGALVADSGEATSMLQQPTIASATDISSSGQIVDGEVLVRQGETITAQHADRAIAAGVLGQLVASAAGGAVSGAASGIQSAASGYGASAQGKMESAALGSQSALEVYAPDGSILVAPGQIITEEILARADAVGKKGEVIAAAGAGAVSNHAQNAAASVKTGAGNLWETVKAKTAELTGAAQDKKAEYDAAAEQSKINNALGRPVTRVILDTSDRVILNTGDIITHAAVNQAREAGVLPVLLDSVYTANPEITPEMMRVQDSGEAALPNQAQPSGGPITATVSPETQSQDTPSQA